MFHTSHYTPTWVQLQTIGLGIYHKFILNRYGHIAQNNKHRSRECTYAIFVHRTIMTKLHQNPETKMFERGMQ
jgi:hypothetical protein